MSISWHLDAEPAPAILVLPPAAASLDEAHAAIELWEHYSRKTLDPTQRQVVEMTMAQTEGGIWAAATTGREMPRQNGKGDEIEVPELWGLVQRAESILHTVHDAVLLASQAQQRMLSVLEGHADLRRLIKRKWMGTGQQMIEMRNGGVIWYRTRTGGGGRGVDDVDRLVIDEAQHATEEQLAAVAPTLLANKNPQLNAMGTAGLAGKSDWWWSVRKRALSPGPGSFGYVGHTAERVHIDEDGRVVQEPVDVQDRSLWLTSNPAVAAGRGNGMEFLEEQLRRLGPASFAREHLGVWDPPSDADDEVAVIDLDDWSGLADTETPRPNPVAFAVEVSEDRKWASIALAGWRGDGLRQLQIVQTGRGTAWVPERMVELREKWRPVALCVNPAGPAGSLVPEFTRRRMKVTLITGRDVTQASAGMLDAITDSTVRHSGQITLNMAVEAAAKRRSGDAWKWASRDPHIDVAPLQAASYALHGLTSKPRTPKGSRERRAVVL